MRSEVNKMKSEVRSDVLVPSLRIGVFNLFNVYFLVLFISQVSSVDLKGKSEIYNFSTIFNGKVYVNTMNSVPIMAFRMSLKKVQSNVES